MTTHLTPTLPPALGMPQEPPRDYVNDSLVLWLQPMRGPGRSQRTGESEAGMTMHLFPSLHPHLGLVATLCFSRWLSFQVPVTNPPASLGHKSVNSSAYAICGDGTIPYGSPKPPLLPINPLLNVLLLVSRQSPAEI